jgi:hypothetical protein
MLTACEGGGGGGDTGGGGATNSPVPQPTNTATTPPIEQNDANSTSIKTSDVFEEIVENTRPGQIAFNVPLKMRVNDASLVEVLITDDLQRNLQKELSDNSGKVDIANLQVSSKLRARLEGVNFNIKSFNEENRFLIKNGVAAWRWSVTPTEVGEQNLYMSIYARVRRNNSDENIDLKTFQRVINVSVTPTSWLNQNWKWVIENSGSIGAILAGISVFIVARWKWVRAKLKKLNRNLNRRSHP